MNSKKIEKMKALVKRVGYDFYRAFLIIVSHFILIYAGIYIGMSKCEARTIYYGSETETITVSYGGETIFRFDESVKTISRASQFSIGPADGNNPDYAVLSITPRFTSGAGKVTFLLANGAVVTAKIVTVSKALPEKVDNFYDFVPKRSLVEKEANSGPEISDLELMKAMIRWEEIVGIKERSLIRTVVTGNSELSAKLVRVYTGAKFNGYVFKIQNLSKNKDYAVDIRALTLGRPNQALLSQVDKGFLKPKEATFLRIVAKPTSVYYNVNLPVGAIQAE
ncbi:MAG: hypothetical protein COV91_03460 [Candidatus Taylorbacteria bacterium CG11_big_fil_rev_8_21_14_0_20_46_11]|uniref:Uncharacterized protein n=1 Tax=Candidatus Taylorbacteria bacterium CG11_big_fil_rev_8_21_14_0_20_46_11 TaxID=1975025 RepID=A0A2H0KBE3_9BACT|nr:MAG: hypothetical protein COV91_03460 [Candidatus Taylorbacteria bacterium CG11_big_fil_rev_8_21_14_0_20_46_11]